MLISFLIFNFLFFSICIPTSFLKKQNFLDKFDKPFKCPYIFFLHHFYFCCQIYIFVLTPSFYYIYFYDPEYIGKDVLVFLRNLVNSKSCQMKRKNCNNKNNKEKSRTTKNTHVTKIPFIQLLLLISLSYDDGFR